MTEDRSAVQRRNKNEEKLGGTLLRCALTASLGGLLFGFDTVVISGAEQSLERLWQLSDGLHGLAMSAALWGTVVGSLVGAYPTDRFGRRPTLIAVGMLFFISAVWSGLATGVYSFMIARFIGGVGVGISTVACRSTSRKSRRRHYAAG